MRPDTWDTAIRQGEDWRRELSAETAAGEPFDFTEHTLKMQIRRPAAVGGALLAELSTSNGRIDIATPGVVKLHLDKTLTTPLQAGGAEHDLLVTPPSGEPFYLVAGTVTIERRVTQ